MKKGPFDPFHNSHSNILPNIRMLTAPFRNSGSDGPKPNKKGPEGPFLLIKEN